MKELDELFTYDGCFNTRSGKKFDLLNPTEDMIDITDISHGLAYRGHFGGQTPQMFSVAQHCLLVVNLLPSRWRNIKWEITMAALLHDAAEAYIGDMIKPIKVMIPKFTEIEDNILEVIFKKFGVKTDYLKAIKPYDLKAQEIEFMAFFKNKGFFNYLSPDAASYAYVDKFYEILNIKDKYESIRT